MDPSELTKLNQPGKKLVWISTGLKRNEFGDNSAGPFAISALVWSQVKGKPPTSTLAPYVLSTRLIAITGEAHQ